MKSKTVEERARRLLDSLGPLEYTKEATARRWVEADLRAAYLSGQEPIKELLATWKRNRASPDYGSGAPGPLYSAGMAAEADSMIEGLEAALNASQERSL